MERLAQIHGWRIREVDIERWGSPVARQYGISKLPTVWLYEGTQLVEEDYKAVLRRYE